MLKYRLFLLATLIIVLPRAHADLVGVDLGPGGRSPQNWTSISANGNYLNLINDEGQPTVVGIYIRNAGTPFSVAPKPTSLPKYKGDLSGLDGNQYQFGGTFEAQIMGLQALKPYNIYMFGLRSGAATQQSMALSGGKGVTVSQKAPDGVLAINDQPGSNQKPLSSYAKKVVASRNGTIEIAITAGPRSNQTFAVAGLAIEGDFLGSSQNAPSPAKGASAKPATSALDSGAGNSKARTQSQPKGPDVIGVSLDMTMKDAFSVIKGAYPEIPLKYFQWSLGQVQLSRIHGGPKYDAGFQGSYQSAGRNDSVTVMSYMPPNDGRVAGIARYTYTGEMLLSDLHASLVEKYGKPHLEIKPDTVLRKPHLIYSWSLNRDGKPLTDPATVIGCTYNQSGNPWDQSAPVFIWKLKDSYNGKYADCGFTLAVFTAPAMRTPVTVIGFGIVMYDIKEIGKSARETWEETDRIAKQLEAEKSKALSGKKPRL